MSKRTHSEDETKSESIIPKKRYSFRTIAQIVEANNHFKTISPLNAYDVVENLNAHDEYSTIVTNLEVLAVHFEIDHYLLDQRIRIFQEMFGESATKDVFLTTSAETIQHLFGQLCETIRNEPLYRKDLFDPIGQSYEEYSTIHKSTESLQVNPWLILGISETNDALFLYFKKVLGSLSFSERMELVDDFINVCVVGMELTFDDPINAKTIFELSSRDQYTFQPSLEELELYFHQVESESKQSHPACSQCGIDLQIDFTPQCKNCFKELAEYPETHWMKQHPKFLETRSKLLKISECAYCQKTPCKFSTYQTNVNEETYLFEKVALPWCSIECWSHPWHHPLTWKLKE